MVNFSATVNSSIIFIFLISRNVMLILQVLTKQYINTEFCYPWLLNLDLFQLSDVPEEEIEWWT